MVDLDPKQIIAQTKQINDLNNLKNRQTNYTNKFKLPKTATNLKILDFLTVPGNNSNVPYQKNECSLYSDTGECFIYNGWAIITDGGKYFNAVVYDGIIDFYKRIENKNLSDLGTTISDLDHQKTIANILASWNTPSSVNYRYILADYNGNTGSVNVTAGTPTVNIDYLVPSVNIAWLWDKIFEHFGFEYTGSVFDTDSFKNIWMTFPNGVTSIDETFEIFASDELTNANNYEGYYDRYWRTLLIGYANPDPFDTNSLETDNSNYKLIVKKSGYYEVVTSGSINTREPVRLFVSKNISNTGAAYLNNLPEYRVMSTDLEPGAGGDDISSGAFYLNAGESVSVLMRHKNGTRDAIRFDEPEKLPDFEISLRRFDNNIISFSEAFSNFSIKDFITEVVHRFGLTLFKNKYNNTYDFLTLEELLHTENKINWSSKFSNQINEKYVYGNYAQQNWFRYNYNDKEANHNDGVIAIGNENINESKDVLKSKIYSPQKDTVSYLSRVSNNYPLWEKEPNDNDDDGEEPIKYKALNKRYYFLRTEKITNSVYLKSYTTGELQLTGSYWIENFSRMSFADVLKDYYTPINSVLEKSKLITAEMWLKDTDIINFDFKKLYYIEQLGGYFLMNKINNYIPGKPTKCELISVITGDTGELPVFMSKIVVNGTQITVHFNGYTPGETYMLQYEVADGVWVNPIGSTESPIQLNMPQNGTFTFRIYVPGGLSNTITATIPSYQTYYF